MSAATGAAQPRRPSAILPAFCGVVAAIALVAYQTWFMPYFQPYFAGQEGLARAVFYSLYGSVLLAATAAWATMPEVRRRTLPLVAVGVLVIAPAFLHPLGDVSRAYIIAMVLAGALVILILASAPSTLLRLSAAITALGALLCLLDAFFVSGFTNTAGRAAGLAINANDAGNGLLLGAVATYRHVPSRFRAAFLVLVAGAILVTLSRSSLLASLLTVLAASAVALWHGRRPMGVVLARPGRGPASATLAAFATIVVLAANANPVFLAALKDTSGLAQQDGPQAPMDELPVRELPAVTAMVPAAIPASMPPATEPAPREAQESPRGPTVPTAVLQVSAGLVPVEAPPPPSSLQASPSAASSEIEALSERLVSEGQRSSLSARLLFLERAMLVYATAPFFGIGLDAAHALAPHNTFVLFALGFGHLGWLVPLAVLGVILASGRSNGIPLAVALLATMATSHNIFVNPSLFILLAVGVAGLLVPAPTADDRRYAPAVAGGALAGVVLFSVGCLALDLTRPPTAVIALEPRYIAPRAGAYQTAVTLPSFTGIWAIGTGGGESVGADYALRGGDAHFTRSEQAPPGPGQFFVRADRRVSFLPPDGSNPVTSGVAYSLVAPISRGPLFWPLLAVVLAWGGLAAVWLAPPAVAGRRPARRTDAIPGQ